ncbi:hypothetical protein GCM10007390_24300 [Persicitalea jodogahamensis]|uniref:Uncharacterized protein n=2 Tax=Persicitalea jodogahamensis TaxID=402147 RepID=A0A8J3D8W6_9BACT|nr:hypothetical protein GCM10007390_24300 [Persicitalea jodogahamensis]
MSCDQSYDNNSEESKNSELDSKVSEAEEVLSASKNSIKRDNSENRVSLPPTRTLPQTKSLPSFDQLLDIYLAIRTNSLVSRVSKLGFEMSNNLDYIQVFEDNDGNHLVVNKTSKFIALSSNYSIDKYEKDVRENGFVLVNKWSEKNIYGVGTTDEYINLDTKITLYKLQTGDSKNGERIERYYSEN